MMFAIRRELVLLALADPEVSERLEGAKSMQEFTEILVDWCNRNKVSVKHIEASA